MKHGVDPPHSREEQELDSAWVDNLGDGVSLNVAGREFTGDGLQRNVSGSKLVVGILHPGQELGPTEDILGDHKP